MAEEAQEVEEVTEEVESTEEAAAPQAEVEAAAPSAEELTKLQKDLERGFGILGNREQAVKEAEEKLAKLGEYEKKLEGYGQLDPLLKALFSGKPDQFGEAISHIAEHTKMDIDDLYTGYKRQASDDPSMQYTRELQSYVEKLESKIEEFDSKFKAREEELSKQEAETYQANFETSFNTVDAKRNPDGLEFVRDRAIEYVRRRTASGTGSDDLNEEFNVAYDLAMKDFDSYLDYKTGQKQVKNEQKKETARKVATLAKKPGSSVSAKKIRSLDEAFEGTKRGLAERM